MVAAAVIGGAVVGGAMSSRSARKASDAQERSAREATEAEREMFEQTRADQEPWRQAGGAALNRLQFLMGLPSGAESLAAGATPPDATGGLTGLFRKATAGILPAGSAMVRQPMERGDIGGQVQPVGGNYGMLTREFTGADLANDPGYQFRLREGQAALDRSASARGGMYSGAQLKALNRYGQDFASNEFTNAFNRNLANRQSLFNMLSGISGTGQVSAQQIGQQGMQLGRDIGSNLMGAGNARASGYLARGNALQGGVNQLASAYNQGMFGGGSGMGQSNWGDLGAYQGAGSNYGPSGDIDYIYG